jgi:hypothetical protein
LAWKRSLLTRNSYIIHASGLSFRKENKSEIFCSSLELSVRIFIMETSYQLFEWAVVIWSTCVLGQEQQRSCKPIISDNFIWIYIFFFRSAHCKLCAQQPTLCVNCNPEPSHWKDSSNKKHIAFLLFTQGSSCCAVSHLCTQV